MPFAQPGDAVTIDFTVQNPSTGALTNADSTPTGTLVQNGTDDADVTVTISNKATGRYKAAFTIPSDYSVGDEVDLYVTATVSTVAGGDVVWRSTLEGVSTGAGGVSDATLKAYFAALARKTSVQLVAQWDTMIPRANSWAYYRIITILAGRGYTKAQIDAWDQIAEYNLALGVFCLLTNGAVIEATSMSQHFIDSFDMEEELFTVLLTSSGAITYPSGYSRG